MLFEHVLHQTTAVKSGGIDAPVHGESAYEGLGGGLAVTLPPREAAPAPVSIEEKVGS